eukprot:scaffold44486_cov46-Attheya_sp.AAC.3
MSRECKKFCTTNDFVKTKGMIAANCAPIVDMKYESGRFCAPGRCSFRSFMPTLSFAIPSNTNGAHASGRMVA